ncbi:hypothetical protein [Paenibacillus odorifer]|uniref:hyaluronate lyase N-terminal domain-containing protein n=1 Tax=Paenibacillus odorifer TaxID=189426 RepID=UPI00096D4E7B|nr:hypothetical protein [Paenibacillus odorifer]OME59491.1 hypothetical protein BSK61_06075 [Paenibacillus odorifer]
MANKIQLMRGTKTQLVAKGGLSLAEPGYCTDTNDLYVGNSSGGDTLFLAAKNIPYHVNRQALINGSLDIWQRGSTVQFSGGSPANLIGYGPDRWWSQIYSEPVGGGAGNWARQGFTSGQTIVPGNPKYFARFNITALPAVQSSSIIRIHQPIENVETFSNEKLTFSFYAKANTTRSISAILLQNFGTGGSADVFTAGDVTTVNLSTSWQLVKVVFTVPSITGKTIGAGSYVAPVILIYKGNNTIIPAPSGTVGSWATGYIDIAQLQLNAGDTALPFQARSVADELALCQRYFEKSHDIEVAPGTATNLNGIESKVVPGNSISPGQQYGKVMYKVLKRVVPTVVIYPYTNPANTQRISSSDGVDLAANSGFVGNFGASGFGVYNNSGTALTVSLSSIIFHWTADAEL